MKDYKIKSFEDACASEGIDPALLPDVSMIPEGLGRWLIAGYKLAVIIAAVNREDNGGEKWEPSYIDGKPKYSPWPDIEADEDNPAGSGFSRFDYGYAGSYSHVGSRLCFRSREACEYVFKTFENDLYKEHLLIT